MIKKLWALNLAALAIVLLSSNASLMALLEHEEEFKQIYPLSRQGNFVLHNINGQVMVATWPEEKVEIRAIKKTKGDPKNLQLVKIEVESSADRVAVKTIYPRLRNTGVSVDFEIRLPEKLALTSLEVVNGQIKINGPLNRLKASLVNGNIQASEIEGAADLETTNGRVEASLTSGPSRIKTVNGAVECELLSLQENLTIETVNGSIEVRLESPESLNAYLDARTTNGGISVDFPILFQNLRRTRRTLEGQVGKGGPLLRLRTVNGPIRLIK